MGGKYLLTEVKAYRLPILGLIESSVDIVEILSSLNWGFISLQFLIW